MALPVPDFPTLLDVLDDRGIRIGTETGRVRIDAPAGAVTPEIRIAIRRYRDLLAWTVVGRGTGHTWAPCTKCGQLALLDPAPRRAGKTVWPRCYLTPGCTGRHTITPDRLT